jgi:hypothetical protein
VGEEVSNRVVEVLGAELDVAALVDDERIEVVLLEPLGLVFVLEPLPEPVGEETHDRESNYGEGDQE